MPSAWENVKVDDSEMPLYVSSPESGGPVPGIVVVHGQSGLEDFIKDTTRMLALQGALTDFRIYWDSVASALGGRELILIDSDKIQGRRQLFLFDPEQLRVPVPMLLPPERRKEP